MLRKVQVLPAVETVQDAHHAKLLPALREHGLVLAAKRAQEALYLLPGQQIAILRPVQPGGIPARRVPQEQRIIERRARGVVREPGGHRDGKGLRAGIGREIRRRGFPGLGGFRLVGGLRRGGEHARQKQQAEQQR